MEARRVRQCGPDSVDNCKSASYAPVRVMEARFESEGRGQRPSVVVGQNYGRWTVLAYSHSEGTQGRFYLCRCECGSEKVVRGSILKRGESQSCGCLAREWARSGNARRRHGQAARTNGKQSPEYSTWSRMRDRCVNPKNQDYHLYGGRGITVDPAWDIFERFYADMGPKPTPQHSIDRIDVDGPYSAANCRWATAKEQRANQRQATHCRNGHPYTEDNLYVQPSTGYRFCRTCRRDSDRRQKAKKRQLTQE